MNNRKRAKLEKKLPQQAVAALNAATRQALDAGLSVVVRIGNDLCRVSKTDPPIVLKTLPPRTKVRDRVKKAST